MRFQPIQFGDYWAKHAEKEEYIPLDENLFPVREKLQRYKPKNGQVALHFRITHKRGFELIGIPNSPLKGWAKRDVT